MNSIVTVAAVAAMAALTGCTGTARGDNGGPTVQRSYQVGAFERIELAGPYDVEVRTGGSPSVSATGPEKLLEKLVVEVEGDRLRIHPRKERGLNFNWSSKGTAQLIVTVPMLRAAAIAGSGDMRIDKIAGERFDGEIAGSGALDLGAVEVGALSLEIAGSGEARARGGQARTARFDIAGSGDIDAGQVAVEEAEVSIAGSGNVAAKARGTADVNIAGSGDVELTGGARCSINKQGSGNVRCS